MPQVYLPQNLGRLVFCINILAFRMLSFSPGFLQPYHCPFTRVLSTLQVNVWCQWFLLLFSFSFAESQSVKKGWVILLSSFFHGICPIVWSTLETFPHAADKNLHVLPDGWDILGISEISYYLQHNLVGKLCYCYSYGNAKVEESNSSHPLVIPVYTGPFRSISIYFMKCKTSGFHSYLQLLYWTFQFYQHLFYER